MDHCERCKGLGKPAPMSPERNVELENFIAAWAQAHGYTMTLTHGPRRSTARLSEEERS